MQLPQSIDSDQDFAEAQKAGRQIYDERFRPVLEPQFNGQYVAVHLETGDYEVGPGRFKPRASVRERHPDGVIMVRFIGTATEDDVPDCILENNYLAGARK
jgi:hypothetical protein